MTPLALGIESGDAEFFTLLPRNSVLPAHAKAVFTTMSDYQRRARVTVLQGERKHAPDNVRLGSFELDSIERAPRGEPEIEVSFTIDVDGILQVDAADRKTGSRRGLKLRAPGESNERQNASVIDAAREAELDEVFFSGGRG